MSRYLWLTCETTYMKRVSSKYYSHINCNKNIKVSCLSSLYIYHNFSSKEKIDKQSKSLYNKKKIRLKKIIPSFNDKVISMSDHEQPNPHHTSYGGQFTCVDYEDSLPSASTHQSKQNNSTRVPNMKNFRVWESVSRASDNNDGTSFRFKVISYNVLAQILLEQHPYLYRHCSPDNLKWNVRADRIYHEIMKMSPDIICLQEVQANHIESFYSKFTSIGYFGIFKRKTGDRHDGCAIYFKKSLFDIQDHLTVEYYQPEMPYLLNRDNIGLMVKLVPKSSASTPFVVATTHLLFNPNRDDVRLAQIQVLLAEIDRFAYLQGECSGHLPIIMTGDLNSTPNSVVVKFLDEGLVRKQSQRDVDRWMALGITDNCQHLTVYLNRLSGQCESSYSDLGLFNTDYCKSYKCANNSCIEYPDLFTNRILTHCLNLKSVYDQIKIDGQREASNFRNNWITVDYIYFSQKSSLRLIERLRLPTSSECEVLGTLPNDVYGSDHLVLGAVFEINAKKRSQ